MLTTTTFWHMNNNSAATSTNLSNSCFIAKIINRVSFILVQHKTIRYRNCNNGISVHCRINFFARIIIKTFGYTACFINVKFIGIVSIWQSSYRISYRICTLKCRIHFWTNNLCKVQFFSFGISGFIFFSDGYFLEHIANKFHWCRLTAIIITWL